MTMALLNAWMALGALLVAIPLVIHLFNRPHFKIVRWGAMMFLRRAFEVRARRMKLEQVLLLILRSLFFVLLALALARPVFRWGEGSKEDPTTHVVVLDGSYSMAQGEGEENAFEKAREAALQVVEDMPDSDNMLVMTAGNKPRLLFPNPSFDREFLRDRIEAAEPGIEQTMDVPKAFEQAYWVLDRATLPRHRIYVMTDGQQHGWRAAETGRWEQVIESEDLLKVEPSAYVYEQRPDAKMENVAVLSVYPRSPVVDVHRTTRFFAELGNYTGEKRSVHVTFRVDGTLSAERDVELPEGVTTIEFDHLFPPEKETEDPEDVEEAPEDPEIRVEETEAEEPAGVSSHYVTVEVDEDDLEIDNVFSLALEVRSSIPVLVVDGEESEDLWSADGGLVALALAAVAVPGQAGLFKPVRQTLHEVEEGALAFSPDYKAIVLADVPSLSRRFRFALEKFVERGGGLLVMLGDRVDKDAYNKMAEEGEGLLPAELEKVESHRDRPFRPAFPAGVAGQILDIFDLGRTRVLSEVRVEKFWRCRAAKDGIVLGMFDDAPFLVYRRYGEGRVALWTTSANAEWTNFPVTQDYLPLLQNLVVYLAGSVQPPINLAQGDTLVYTRPADLVPEPEGEDDEPIRCTITTPEGEHEEIEGNFAGDEWVAEWQETTAPGVYTVTMEGAKPKYYAVSFVPGEGDLAPLDDEARDTFDNTVVSEYVRSDEELRAAVNRETGVREWWRILVFLGLLILTAELYLGWRFSA